MNKVLFKIYFMEDIEWLEKKKSFLKEIAHARTIDLTVMDL